MLKAAAEPEAGREVLALGRLCANAWYNLVGYQLWCDHRDDVEIVTVAADIASYAHVNANYWLYGYQGVTEVAGMGSLCGVLEMRRTLSSCMGLTEIDLSGSTRPRSRTSPTPSAGATRS